MDSSLLSGDRTELFGRVGQSDPDDAAAQGVGDVGVMVADGDRLRPSQRDVRRLGPAGSEPVVLAVVPAEGADEIASFRAGPALADRAYLAAFL